MLFLYHADIDFSFYYIENKTNINKIQQDLRKEVKAKRPQDVAAYIIRYCQAMQKGENAPDTVDELLPPPN